MSPHGTKTCRRRRRRRRRRKKKNKKKDSIITITIVFFTLNYIFRNKIISIARRQFICCLINTVNDWCDAIKCN
jgi:hypothetical protein